MSSMSDSLPRYIIDHYVRLLMIVRPLQLDSLFLLSRPHTPASAVDYLIIHTLCTSIYIAIIKILMHIHKATRPHQSRP